MTVTLPCLMMVRPGSRIIVRSPSRTSRRCERKSSIRRTLAGVAVGATATAGAATPAAGLPPRPRSAAGGGTTAGFATGTGLPGWTNGRAVGAGVAAAGGGGVGVAAPGGGGAGRAATGGGGAGGAAAGCGGVGVAAAGGGGAGRAAAGGGGAGRAAAGGGGAGRAAAGGRGGV